MIKIIWLVKRKPGMTFEDFRTHFEKSHAVLGQKYIGHLLLEYRRNYNMSMQEGAEPNPLASDYDLLAEWVMRDEAAFEECKRIISDPVIGKLFHEDEEHFLDRESVRMVRCDCRETVAA